MATFVGDNLPPDLRSEIQKFRVRKRATSVMVLQSNDTSYVERMVTNDNRIIVVKLIRNQSLGLRERALSLYAEGSPYVLVAVESGTTYKFPYLVLDYMYGNSLEWVLKNDECYNVINDQFRIFCIFRCIIKGLQHLHQLQIAHRDIKPGNILFPIPVYEIKSWDIDDKDNVYCKISDMGCGKYYRDDVLKSIAGTLEYMAPEILLGQEIYDESVDIWSFGVVLYQVVHRALPYQVFDENNRVNQYNSIMSFISSDKYKMLSYDSCSFDSICYKCLQMVPEERPSASQLLEMLESSIKHQDNDSSIQSPNFDDYSYGFPSFDGFYL